MGGVVIISLLEKREGGSGSISEQTRQKKRRFPGPQSASVSCNFQRELSALGLTQDRLKSTSKSPKASLSVQRFCHRKQSRADKVPTVSASDINRYVHQICIRRLWRPEISVLLLFEKQLLHLRSWNFSIKCLYCSSHNILTYSEKKGIKWLRWFFALLNFSHRNYAFYLTFWHWKRQLLVRKL